MNNYHVNEEIAKGNNSVIYKARQKKSINYFAIKSLEKCLREKLMNEVKIWPQLDHVNIIKFYNWYETKNHLWAIYEYSPGGNLHSLIQQDKRITEAGIKPFFKDLIQGLHYMHSKGVIYCDLKPSNVLLNEFGTVKYCDFGLARLSINLIQTDQEVKEGSKKGTPCYMAPELFEDDGVYSMQSDLWSLGCVMYEMATGAPPFSSSSLSELVSQICNKDIPLDINNANTTTFSIEFNSLLHSLLSKNPTLRPSWNQLLQHPFFDWNPQQLKNLLKVPLPPQPHFDRWAKIKYPPPAAPVQDTPSQQSQLSQIISTYSTKGDRQPINILRLSLNAKKNLLKDKNNYESTNNNNNNNNNQESSDFHLHNFNQIIDIGGNSENTVSTTDYSSTNIDSSQLPPSSNRTIDPPLSAHASRVVYQNLSSPSAEQSLNSTQSKQSQQPLSSRQRFLQPDQQQQASQASSRSNQPSLSPNSSALRTPTSKLASARTLSNGSNVNLHQIQNVKVNTLVRTPKTPSNNNNNNTTYNQNTNSTLIADQDTSLRAKNASPHSMNNPMSPHSTILSNTSTLYNINNNKKSPSQIAYSSSKSPQSQLSKTYNTNTSALHSQTPQSTQILQQQQHNTSLSPMHRQQSSAYLHNTSNCSGFEATTPKSQTLTPESANKIQQQIIGLSNNASGEGIEKLFIHNSDTQVKPIIGHKDIEKYPQDVTFVRESLPFRSFNVEDVEKSCESPEIEGLFQDLFKTLSVLVKQQQQQPININSQLNVLCYFEKIVQNSAVANRLINSAFINLLAELLVNVNVSAIRLRVATSIGFLLRFANSIDNSLTQLNLPFILIQVINTEADNRVRRKLMAALGEYLFYAATQVDENPTNSVWRISSGVLSFIMRTIRNTDEDELVKFYACKTIENITSQAPSSSLIEGSASNINTSSTNSSVGSFFCCEEAIAGLAAIFTQSKNEDFRASALMSLLHIQRIRIDFSTTIIYAIGGPSVLRDILKIESGSVSNRIQQASLTIINSYLWHFSSTELAQIEFLRESTFYEAIVRLLDSAHAIIRGKSVLSICIGITKIPQHCLVYLYSQTKFFATIEKLTRDNFKYVQATFAKLKIVLASAVPSMLAAITLEINRIKAEEQEQLLADQSNNTLYQFKKNTTALQQQQQHRRIGSVTILQGNLQLLQVLIQFANNALLKNYVFQDTVLNESLNVFNLMHSSNASALVQAKQVLVNFYEVLLLSGNYVIDRSEFFLYALVPVLMGYLEQSIIEQQQNSQKMVSIKDSDKDLQFSYLKLIQEVMSLLLLQSQSIVLSQSLNELFINRFVCQLLSHLLYTEDSLRVIAMKLLQTLVETQPALYIGVLKQCNMLGVLISQFNENATRSTLRLVARIVQTSSTLGEIQQFNICNTAVNVFAHFIQKAQDQCYEDMLDILLAVTNKITSVQPITNIDKPTLFDFTVDNSFDSLFIAYNMCFQLLGCIDASVSEKAQAFMISVIYIYARATITTSSNGNRLSAAAAQILAKPESIVIMLNFLQSFVMVESIMKRIVRVINWLVSSSIVIPKEIKNALISQMENVAAIHAQSDMKFSATIRQITSTIRMKSIS